MSFICFFSGVISIVLGVLITIWVYKKPITFKEDPNNPVGADEYHIYESWHRWMNIDGYYVGIMMMVLGVVLIFNSITCNNKIEKNVKQSKDTIVVYEFIDKNSKKTINPK